MHILQAEFTATTFVFPDALNNTTAWIKSALEELQASIPSDRSQGKDQRIVPGPLQILGVAFLQILTWDYNRNPLPEVRLW